MRLRLLAASLIVLFASGCSVIATQRTADLRRSSEVPGCTRHTAAPALDGFMAGALVAVTAAQILLGQPSTSGPNPALINGAGAVMFAGSALYGAGNVQACEKAWSQREEHLRQSQVTP